MKRYATYVCTLGCVAECPCAVRASGVYIYDDGECPLVICPEPEYDVEPGLPCVVFRSDDEHPHPAKHIAVGGDGVMHEWADGDTACRRYRLCPECDMTTCPGTVELLG